MNRVSKIINAGAAWEQGWSGKNVNIAVLDTGIGLHPDLRERIVEFKDFVNMRMSAYDDYGHGSHVSGILAGEGKIRNDLKGIAYGAGIIAVKVLDQNGNGKRENVLNGIMWVLENSKKYNIRIMNVSVGTVKEGDHRDRKLIEKVEEAWNQGIVVVCAAGNLGPGSGTITAPGNSKKVITVGISDELNEFYSGRGPTQNCICKPDIVAPGTKILSCNAFYRLKKQYYCVKSGTSMATPMVSAAAALLLEKEPWLTNVEIKMRLMECARDLKLPRNRQGWGELDIKRFLRI